MPSNDDYRELAEEMIKVLADCRTYLRAEQDDRRVWGSPFSKMLRDSLVIRIDEIDRHATEVFIR